MGNYVRELLEFSAKYKYQGKHTPLHNTHSHVHTHIHIFARGCMRRYSKQNTNIRTHFNRNIPRYNSRCNKEQTRIPEFQNKKCEVNIPYRLCFNDEAQQRKHCLDIQCDVSISILELQQP